MLNDTMVELVSKLIFPGVELDLKLTFESHHMLIAGLRPVSLEL